MIVAVPVEDLVPFKNTVHTPDAFLTKATWYQVFANIVGTVKFVAVIPYWSKENDVLLLRLRFKVLVITPPGPIKVICPAGKVPVWKNQHSNVKAAVPIVEPAQVK